MGIAAKTRKQTKTAARTRPKKAPPVSKTEFSPEFYRELVDNVPQNLYCTDLKGRIIFANKQYCKSAGISLEKILGKTAYDFFPKKLADKYTRDDRKVIRTGRALDIREINKPPTQEAIHVRVVKSPLRDTRGRIVGVQGTYWDVTAETVAAEKVAEQAYFLNTLMNHLPDFVYFKDRESRFLRVSRATALKHGLNSADLLIGKTDLEIFLGEHAEEALKDEQQVMRTGIPLVGKEEKETFPDGSVQWVSTTKMPLRDNDGNIVGTFGVSRNITDRKRAEELLYRRAFYDPLTELPNRALFMDRLMHLFRRAVRQPETLFAVLFLDMDRFKSINDTLGHEAGDTVLVAAARRLESCVRPGDTVARLGGDEFTVLLEDISDVQDAVRVAERILQSLATPIPVAGTEIYTSVSVGIALSTSTYQDPEEILRDADIAMYGAKILGKSRFEIFHESMHDRAAMILDTETSLRRALEKREFRVHYQPIVSMSDRRVVGFEALVRWQHPTRGLLPPDQFLNQAEEIGVLAPIGLWVLEEACSQTKEWQQRYPADPPLKISVNISSRQLMQRGFLEQVKLVLDRTQLDPRCLCLEIAERTLVENLKNIATLLAQLRCLSVRVNIDDFGTGYSALQHLKHYPADSLKVDGSFLKMSGTNDVHGEVLRTIARLAQALGMTIVAERVETTKQMEQLRDVDCKTGQGFLFSEALEKVAAEALLKKGGQC